MIVDRSYNGCNRRTTHNGAAVWMRDIGTKYQCVRHYLGELPLADSVVRSSTLKISLHHDVAHLRVNFSLEDAFCHTDRVASELPISKVFETRIGLDVSTSEDQEYKIWFGLLNDPAYVGDILRIAQLVSANEFDRSNIILVLSEVLEGPYALGSVRRSDLLVDEHQRIKGRLLGSKELLLY